MLNGKSNDNPISDIFIHGLHPYPEELEIVIRKLHKINPGIFDKLEWAPFDWEKGIYIPEAIRLIKNLMENQCNPEIYNKLIQDYYNEIKK